MLTDGLTALLSFVQLAYSRKELTRRSRKKQINQEKI